MYAMPTIKYFFVTGLTTNVTDIYIYFFTVNSEEDVCGCGQGACECDKETQRTFCTCFKGFEGNSLFYSFVSCVIVHPGPFMVKIYSSIKHLCFQKVINAKRTPQLKK